MEERTDWVDYAKGLGIILVVYAHLLSSGYHANLAIPEYYFLLSDSIVYSFHMPLFFFLAGLFVEQSYKNRDPKKFLINKLDLIAYPYFIWSILQVAVELYFSNHSQRGISYSDLLAIPYQPWSQFWFLYALLLMYLAYMVLKRFGRFSILLLTVIAVILFFKPINSEMFGLIGFSVGFLFFVFGVLAKKYISNFNNFSIPIWVACTFLPVLIVGGWYIFEYKIGFTRLTSGSHPFFYLCLASVGIASCISLAQFLGKNNYCRFVRLLGKYSIEIYLVHMLAGVAVRIILLKFLSVENPMLHIIIGVSVGLFAPIFLYKTMQKINFPYLFALPRKANG